MWRRSPEGRWLGKLHNGWDAQPTGDLLTRCTCRLKKRRPTRVGELGCRAHHCYPEAFADSLISTGFAEYFRSAGSSSPL